MTTTTIDAHREEMLSQLSRGNAYGFLTMTHPYLRLCPNDGYVRLMALREYLKLGLVAPARDLINDPAAAQVEGGEPFNALAGSVRSIPTSPIPWDDCQERFEANLQALRKRGFDTTEIATAWAQRSDDFERYLDKNGVTQIRRRNDEGAWDWIPALRDHARADAAQTLPEGVCGRMPGPYIFSGLGQGGFFERVYRATLDTFLGFSCALLVVEPDRAAVAMVLHLREWEEILSDQRVLLYIGSDWEDQLRRAWRDDVDLPFPTQVITSGPRREEHEQRLMTVVESAMSDCERAIQDARREMEERYASRDLRFWSNRFDEALSGRGAPLRILAAVSTHTTFLQYSMRDAKRAFESLGHQCEVLIEKTCYQITSPLHFHRAVLELDPDVFFIIDHLRPEFADVLPQNLPILTWDQDQLPHVITCENLRGMAAHDFLVGCSKLPCLRLGANARQIRQSRVPTCPEEFSGAPLSDEEAEQFSCDVSFVSHASQTPKAFHEEERRVYKDAKARRLLDVLYELVPAALTEHKTASGYATAMVLREGMAHCGIRELPQELEVRLRDWYLWRLADRMFRHEALEWAADWARRGGHSLRIYGNGWNDHPTLSEFASGPAVNGRELLCIYRASKINLQLMPAGFLHQRAMDGLAAGGFFLTRSVPRDVTGRRLRALIRRIEELDLADTHALFECEDESVRLGLQVVLGPWLESMRDAGEDAVEYLRVTAELPFPDEMFPCFDEITFDSAASFEAAADRFIDDTRSRETLAQDMRAVVVRELAYQPTMKRFLSWMRNYLKTRAGMM